MTIQTLSAVTLLVHDYDDAIRFFVHALGFVLLEDTVLGESKRWVRVAPSGGGSALLLAQASTPEQIASIGNQCGGRVGFFLQTNDFARDHARMMAAGVHFREDPRHEPYGTVAVFTDISGNGWDLIEPRR